MCANTWMLIIHNNKKKIIKEISSQPFHIILLSLQSIQITV